MKTRRKGMAALVLLLAVCGCDSYMDNGGYYSNETGVDGYNQPLPGKGDSTAVENPFVQVATEPVSTFSVDADGASFAYVRAAIHNGFTYNDNERYYVPVRIEEFLNYFPFDYKAPTGEESVALNAELTVCPWNTKHCLMRLGMKGKEIPLEELPNANYVFLIDVSGSMYPENKLPLLKEGFSLLTDQLRDNDRVSIVTYSGEVKQLLEPTLASNKTAIKKAISKLSADGGTAGGEALKLAYKLAKEYYIEGGNNRIIMGTDGDFNLGKYQSTEELLEMVETERDNGVYLTCLGVGNDNFNDRMMESISNSGNGTAEYIDCADEIVKTFVHDLGKFYAVATDSKIQITFNPARVKAYRLIGYENRMLKKEDFEDDKKDAGEIGMGQTITALYELEMADEGTAADICATFDFRYKKTVGAESRPLQLKVTGEPVQVLRMSANANLASSLAAFGMLLKNSAYSGMADKDMVLQLANSSLTFDPHGYRAAYVQLVRSWNTKEAYK